MSSSVTKAKPAWEDRYASPTIEQLRADFGKQIGALVDHARERLRAMPGLAESLSWQGVSWRWSLTYRHESDAARPWAILILQPTRPRLAVPLRSEMLASLPAKKLSKGVRDGIIHSPVVAGVRWPQWEFNSKTQLDEILGIVELKCSLTAAATA